MLVDKKDLNELSVSYISGWKPSRATLAWQFEVK
jgi:hypothetical protein